MIDQLLDLDEKLFLILNGFGHPYLDAPMLWLSDKYIWIPLYALVVFLIYQKFGTRFWIPVLSLIVLVTLTDQVTSSFMKPFFERLRPCHNPQFADTIFIIKGCGGKYGFASSHAANTMGFALFNFFLLDKKWVGRTLITWSGLVGFSRIYLGVHYPGDVLAGFIVGGLLAYLVFRIMIILGSGQLKSPFLQ